MNARSLHTRHEPPESSNDRAGGRVPDRTLLPPGSEARPAVGAPPLPRRRSKVSSLGGVATGQPAEWRPCLHRTSRAFPHSRAHTVILAQAGRLHCCLRPLRAAARQLTASWRQRPSGLPPRLLPPGRPARRRTRRPRTHALPAASGTAPGRRPGTSGRTARRRRSLRPRRSSARWPCATQDPRPAPSGRCAGDRRRGPPRPSPTSGPAAPAR